MSMFLKYNLEKEKQTKHHSSIRDDLTTAHKSLSDITKEYKLAKQSMQRIFIQKKDILTDYDKYFNSSK